MSLQLTYSMHRAMVPCAFDADGALGVLTGARRFQCMHVHYESTLDSELLAKQNLFNILKTCP